MKRAGVRFTLLCVMALGLAACVNSVRTDVSRFTTTLPSDLGGKTFAFVELDSQRGSAEYAQHAAAIAGHLERQGLMRTTDLRRADYAVSFIYGQSSGQTKSETFPVWGQTGGGTSYSSGTVNAYGAGGSGFGNYSSTTYTPPTYGVVGSHTINSTEYTRYINIQIYDWQASVKTDKLTGLWEANATSTGSSSSFAAVSGCMIQAIFQDFRKSGSEKITLPTQTC